MYGVLAWTANKALKDIIGWLEICDNCWNICETHLKANMLMRCMKHVRGADFLAPITNAFCQPKMKLKVHWTKQIKDGSFVPHRSWRIRDKFPRPTVMWAWGTCPSTPENGWVMTAGPKDQSLKEREDRRNRPWTTFHSMETVPLAHSDVDLRNRF